MRIARVRIENFRCLQSIEAAFDDVTTFIGPNGVGKSTVLRGLGWFFNGGPIGLEDVSAGVPVDSIVRVAVTFAALTEIDRTHIESLGLDDPGDTWTVERRCSAGGTAATFATGLTFPAFAAIRAAGGALAMRSEYKALCAARPELNLPSASSQAAVLDAMRVWEAQHSDLLVPGEFEISHPFGFGDGAAFSGTFDYVLVDADLRAEEESADSRGSLINQILAHRVDRGPAGEAFSQLAADASDRHQQIVEEHLAPLLAEVSGALSAELSEFTHARAVKLRGSAPPMSAVRASISLSVEAGETETSVDRQGHGFRRALLIALLRFLARTAGSSGNTVVMAIEEPELFQHPSQARVFARILRELSESSDYQVTYATHSPYFIDARYFDQVRRLTHDSSSDGVPSVAVRQVSLEQVVAELEPLIKVDGIKSRWSQVCTNNLAEALFAEAVVVVEGDIDAGVLEGLARRAGATPLEDLGIVVADAHGKNGLLTPIAILRGLGIPLIAVYDTDSNVEEKVKAKKEGNNPAYVAAAVNNNAKSNLALQTYFGVSGEEPLATGRIAPDLFAMSDNLEKVLEAWPEWGQTRKRLIADGRGSPGKNAATYALATACADGEPIPELLEIVEAARALVAGQ